MKKILLGGSPCTFWSISQAPGTREVKAEGEGWELFLNYLIAKKKFRPDFFLYENNKSAAEAIKRQIADELKVDLMYINSALVSAQNRNRFYAFNWKAEQPQDRGIKFIDILENGETYQEKAHTLTTRSGFNATIKDTLRKKRNSIIALPIGQTKDKKAYCVTANYQNGAGGDYTAHTLKKGVKSVVAEIADEQTEGEKTYIVKNKTVKIREESYDIDLPDGIYCFRKMTPTECERLQTMPDGYTKAASNRQRYKMLGNGWTAEVIIHLLKEGLKDVPRDEELIVLSMYDGIGTGRYCLEKLGFTNITYYAYEIDKYAVMVALDNYPDIIEMGDAFQLRNDDWNLNGTT